MQRTLSVINLSAIRNNALRIKKLSKSSKFYAVVKADAYGHGAEEVSRCIEDIVDGFCVAIIKEGIALRVAGITKKILVFTPPLDCYDVLRARAYNLTVTVNSVETAELTGGLPCHIKINTGMNRHGCNLEELPELLKTVTNAEGVYSHFFAPENDRASEAQFKLFGEAVKLVKRTNPEATAHISASGGILRG